MKASIIETFGRPEKDLSVAISDIRVSFRTVSLARKIKLFIKIAIASFIYYLGFFHLLKFMKRRNTVLLCYHRIIENFYEENKYSQNGLLVSKGSFIKQLDFLKRHYNIISMDDFIAYLEDRNKLQANSLLITFDDGYRDNYSIAYPILKKYRIPATIFLTTDFIGSPKYPSWEKDRLDKEKLMLSWEEVIEMSKDNICFGAHTKTHPVYDREDLDNAFYKEISESKAIIEEKIKKEIKTFAFPKGIYNSKALNFLEKEEYSCAFSLGSQKKWKGAPKYKRFAVERIPINEGMYSNGDGTFYLSIFACALLGFWRKYF